MLGCAVGIFKALRNQAYVRSAHRLAEVGEVAHIAEVEFIDRRGVEGLGIAQGEQLRAAGGEGIEAGNAGAALRHWVRIVEIEVVDEVVGGEQAPAAYSHRGGPRPCRRAPSG